MLSTAQKYDESIKKADTIGVYTRPTFCLLFGEGRGLIGARKYIVRVIGKSINLIIQFKQFDDKKYVNLASCKVPSIDGKDWLSMCKHHSL